MTNYEDSVSLYILITNNPYMKKTTCKALGGACDADITGNTPEEIGDNCKKHVMDMILTGDADHLQAVEAWKKRSEEDQKSWFKTFTENFDNLPEA